MEFEKNCFSDAMLINPKCNKDDRGFFQELYKKSVFHNQQLKEDFCQINFSHSHKSVIRGLHYQLNPSAQGKLVKCTSGIIWDVIVDIRKDSPYSLQWKGFVLDPERGMIYIPPGFAHGFAALEDNTSIVYLCTSEYDQETERGIKWDDKILRIEWPIYKPIVSEKDQKNPTIKDAELFEY